MFEVGFSELLVIFVLALIVLGPEKLPRLASQVGRWIGRARAMAKQFRDQLEEEVNVAESNKWKPTPTPEPTPAAEPPPATAAEPGAATPSAGAESTTSSAAGTAPPEMHATAEQSPADPHTHEMHSGLQNGAHNSGPPPEPEASVYEPPAYSSSSTPSSGAAASGAPSPGASSPGTSSTGTSSATASPAPTPNAAPTAEPHAPTHPHATSDDTPLRPGDVVTTTHERGI